jgi:glutamate N-acetyltransferase / amino-acid N-acetyltransferase
MQIKSGIKGWQAAGITAGLKPSGKSDLALLVSERPANAAALFTTNQVQAAPVQVSKKVMATSSSKLLGCVVNSGQANACTGAQGLADAEEMRSIGSRILAGKTGNDGDVFVMSTGVIGVPLRMDVVRKGIESASEALGNGAAHWRSAATAICTTDTRAKLAHRRYLCEKSGDYVDVVGMAKGAGMIHPNMATMLSAVVSTVQASPATLDAALRHANDRSFSAIDVDGDTSTNDTLLLMANGASSERCGIDDRSSIAYGQFEGALVDLTRELAQKIVFDAEGASKFVEIVVRGAKSERDALQVARTIAKSSLVKCALWGGDANWGRIMCAAGYSGVPFEQSRANLFVSNVVGGQGATELPTAANSVVQLVRNGQPISENRAAAGALSKATDRLAIFLDIDGDQSAAAAANSKRAVVYTCDLSPEYVHFNGAYTT